MLNKRIKEGIKSIRKPEKRVRFTPGTASLMALCVMMLIVATFTQIKINFNVPSENGVLSYLKFEYIPQIPVVLFIAALLGDMWGTVTVLIYIIMGLTTDYAVFALGGGLSYIFQSNFGYIFGYILSVIYTAKYLKKGKSVLKYFAAVGAGVLAVHVTGIIYLVITSLIKHDSFSFICNMIYYQSLAKILYDFVFGFIAVFLGKGIRRVSRLVL